MLSVAAIAYEEYNNPIMSDAEFDSEALKVDLSIATNRPDLDEWFKEKFNPHSGQWALSHPELDKLHNLTRSLINENNKM